jgi:hypothetical protein
LPRFRQSFAIVGIVVEKLRFSKLMTMPRFFLASLTSLLVAAQILAADSVTASASPIGIGKDEDKRTHLNFTTEKGAHIVKVTTHLTIDQVAPAGLNFFAIQVNFPNKTWAHGGPQMNGKADHRIQYANWGGLVNRGGGSADYTQADPSKDFYLIECGIDKPNTVPFAWKQGREYILTVERGRQLDLPAGSGHGGKHDITLDKRQMWEWKFTIVPADGGKDVERFSSFIYDSADHITWFCVWNESGYGSKSDEQHARWTVPTYWVEGDTKEKTPAKWTRF